MNQKAKINIFDRNDGIKLGPGALMAQNYQSESALVTFKGPSDSRSVSQMSTSLEPLTIKRSKAIDYLKCGNEGKESVKDFISISRQILMSQISINAKTDENQRLKEYIQMEQEKLDEARKFLEEDKEKFEKLMNDSEKMAKKVMDEVEARAKDKRDIIKKIEELNTEISVKEG